MSVGGNGRIGKKLKRSAGIMTSLVTWLVTWGLRASVVLLLANAVAARAAEITVLSSTGVKSVVEELAPQFEKTTGNKVEITFDASNLLVKQARITRQGRKL